MTYTAPQAEQRFVLETIAEIASLGVEADMVEAILGESAKLAGNVFAPLNQPGDRQGARWSDGAVTLPPGFREAYAQYVEGGWSTLGASPDHGGQGLPFVLASAVQEQLTSANMAFSLCMMLTQGAIEALQAHGSPEQQRDYLTKLVTGEWTGTMNLTEPQAGSDVGALRTRAESHGDGSYRIAGSKIFITWGEHDVADNIVHLVLARLPGAPAGTKGISLFLVPKILPDGTANDLRCASIEHKLGIHASPTCTMAFGDHGNCIGWLVGAEGAGMKAMFTMMNHARVNVGLQGVAIAERAWQDALAYARERVQGKRIVEFADVRRTLMTMKALTQGARALAYLNAAAVDRAHAGDAEAQRLADLLTPVTKAWATDVGVDVASLGVQVFGGMGYIEETGAAQHLRDARIAPIYEGTNGIQAMDLVGRKLGQGAWQDLFADIRADIATLSGDLTGLAPYLDDGLAALENVTRWMLAADPDDAAAGASPYLRMFGIVAGGWLLAKQAQAATRRLADAANDTDFLQAKIGTARFFAEQLLPQASALLGPATRGSATLRALTEDQLAS